MLIGICSDTHDRMPAIAAALDCFAERQVGCVLHAGDIVSPFAAKMLDAQCPAPLHVIYGNNDGERAGLKQVLPQLVDGPLVLTLEGRSILMHHFLDWIAPDDLSKAEIVVSGHDHEARVTERDGRLLINPGECCGWLSGRCTVALLETESRSAEIVEIQP